MNTLYPKHSPSERTSLPRKLEKFLISLCDIFTANDKYNVKKCFDELVENYKKGQIDEEGLVRKFQDFLRFCDFHSYDTERGDVARNIKVIREAVVGDIKVELIEAEVRAPNCLTNDPNANRNKYGIKFYN